MGKADKKMILIVDDEEEACRVLSEYLKKKGFIAEIAKNGKEAIEAIKKKQPDLMILDLLMPVMDGFAVLREVRSNQTYASIPVIMLTVKSDSQHLGEGISQQVDFYLPKPFKLDNLMHFINLLLKD